MYSNCWNGVIVTSSKHIKQIMTLMAVQPTNSWLALPSHEVYRSKLPIVIVLFISNNVNVYKDSIWNQVSIFLCLSLVSSCLLTIIRYYKCRKVCNSFWIIQSKVTLCFSLNNINMCEMWFDPSPRHILFHHAVTLLQRQLPCIRS